MRDRAMRTASTIAVLAIIIVCSSCAGIRAQLARSGSVATPAASPGSGDAATVVKAVNRFRVEHQLPALAVSGALVNKAKAWAAAMAGGSCGTSGGVASICHSSLASGIGVSWLWLGENVGSASPRSYLSGVIVGFQNSPEHRANILSTRATSVGVGVAYSGNDVYVVEEFMQAA